MRRQVILTPILLAVGVALLLAGALLWRQATTDQEEAELQATYERAILLDQGRDDLAASVDTDPDAERAAPIVLLVLGVGATASGLGLARARPRS